jgi:hypothetical protein
MELKYVKPVSLSVTSEIMGFHRLIMSLPSLDNVHTTLIPYTGHDIEVLTKMRAVKSLYPVAASMSVQFVTGKCIFAVYF